MNYRSSIFIIVFLGIFFFATSSVNAQKTRGFSVSPPSFDLNANPGDSLNHKVKIENLTNNVLVLKAIPSNFAAYGNEGQVELTDEPNSFSISSWLKMDKTTVTIPPKSTVEFKYTVNIPKDAEPGSHYGAVVFTTDSKVAKGAASGATFNQQIGSLVLLKLPGDVYENAKIISFEPSQTFFKDPKVSLTALIENTGNVHIKPYGSIVVKNIIGMKLKTVEIAGKNVLPGSKRLFENSFKFNSIGWYKADLNLLYSNGGKIMKSEVWFLALNLNRLIKIIAVVVVILVLYFIVRKRLNKALSILIRGK